MFKNSIRVVCALFIRRVLYSRLARQVTTSAYRRNKSEEVTWMSGDRLTPSGRCNIWRRSAPLGAVKFLFGIWYIVDLRWNGSVYAKRECAPGKCDSIDYWTYRGIMHKKKSCVSDIDVTWWIGCLNMSACTTTIMNFFLIFHFIHQLFRLLRVGNYCETLGKSLRQSLYVARDLFNVLKY